VFLKFSLYGWSVASGLTVKIGIVQGLRVQGLRVQDLRARRFFAKLVQTITEKHQAVFNVDARRHVEERLEASRVQKQTQDYDFDLD
jgi:hypothetical protein